jgi:hypothetical protein
MVVPLSGVGWMEFSMRCGIGAVAAVMGLAAVLVLAVGLMALWRRGGERV